MIADSFDGRTLHDHFADHLQAERSAAKADPQSRAFYAWCQGPDWETIVDLDTAALLQLAEEKRYLFHKPLAQIRIPLLLMGSRRDEMCRKNLEEEYQQMAAHIPRATIQMFEHGGHPAILTNAEQAAEVICTFMMQSNNA